MLSPSGNNEAGYFVFLTKRDKMQQKIRHDKMNKQGIGAVFLLPLFWSFLLLLLFKFLFPFFSTTIGIGPFYGIICMMVLFAFFAPFVHNFFYQVSYFKMACLWMLFTGIGVLRLEYQTFIHSQKQLVFHLLSWQLPAIVFSLIYTLLYSKDKSSLKINMPNSNAF